MQLEWDDRKRATTLRERGLDFAWAADVFAGDHLTAETEGRTDAHRFITIGRLTTGRTVVLVWTPRGAARRIISLRYAHAHEVAKFKARLAGR